jgi:enoyl-CoA hydratase
MSAIINEDEGHVRVLTLDRPQARNAVDPATAAALREAFEAFEKDDEARILVLTGAGGHFCAGADLEAVSSGEFSHDPLSHGPLGPTRMQLAKPMIAAVEGYAVAGGLELALMCDLRIVSETAVFGVFCRRWGVPLIDGGTIRLPRLIGQSRALDMILTGRPVGATEALAFGLANRVVAAGDARKEAIALAEEIASFPQACVASDRRSLLDARCGTRPSSATARWRSKAVMAPGVSPPGQGARGVPDFQGKRRSGLPKMLP